MMTTWFFGQYIERLLEKKGWNRADLASHSGLTKSQVNWIVAGQKKGIQRPPDMRQGTLDKLAQALNVPISKLQDALKGIDPEQMANFNDSQELLKNYKNAQLEIKSLKEKVDKLEIELLLVGEEKKRLKEQLTTLIRKFYPTEEDKKKLLQS